MSPEVKFFIFLSILVSLTTTMQWAFRQRAFNIKLLAILSELKNHEGNKQIPTKQLHTEYHGDGISFVFSWVFAFVPLGILLFNFFVV